MNKKFIIFSSIVAVIVWSSSWWLYHIYMNVVHSPGWSEDILIKRFKTSCTIAAFIYIIIQAILLKKSVSKYLSIIQKAILSCAGLLLIGILANRKLNAEGCDIVFLSFVSFVSGLLLKSDIKMMFSALAIWFFIILINETIVQGVIFSDIRKGQPLDIVYNMAGILIGLFLSRKYLWFKC